MSRAEDGDDGTQDDLAALAERFAALWREQAARTADDPATAEAMALMARFWRPFQPAGVPGFGAADPLDPTAMMRQMQAQMEAVTAAMTAGAAGAGDNQGGQGGADDGTAASSPASGPAVDPAAGTATAGGSSDDRDRRLDEFDRRLRDIEGKLDALLDSLGGGSAPRSGGDRGGAAGAGSKGGGKKSRAKKSAAKRPAGRKPRS